MKPLQRALAATTVLILASAPGWADTPVADPSKMWECPQADGSSVYTNKEKAGCRAMSLKPLSVVPSLDNMPTIPHPVAAPAYDIPPYQYPAQMPANRNVPEWARDWYANNTASGSVHAEVCTMYMEYLQLAQKTRGGLWFGSDPSYGGDLSGRNQRGPSYSFYDNARWMALSRMFGTGFVPVGC
jgi:hypothetical protein